jgi:Fis family transcriptional regulator
VDKRPLSEADLTPAADGSPRHRLRESVRIAAERYLRAFGEDPPGDLYHLLLAEVEAPLFEAVLRHYRGNQTRAAQALGISRVTLRRKLRQLDGGGR